MSEQPALAPSDEVLVFTVGGEKLALAATEVMEIIRPPLLTRVPNGPENLLGVANMRGTVLPVVSLSGLLGTASSSQSRSTRVVVVRGKAPVGLLVDEVAALSTASDARLIALDDVLGQMVRTTARPERKAAEIGIEPLAPVNAPAPERIFVAFSVAAQEYALPIEEVVSVTLAPEAVTSVPRTDEAMLGVADVDGALVPLVSARVLLGFPHDGHTGISSRVLLMRLAGELVGLVVDGIRDIVRVAPAALDPVPPVLTRAKGEAQIDAICRLGDDNRLVSILTGTKLFDPETIARVLAQAEAKVPDMSDIDQTAEATEQFIIFQLGDETFGLPIGSIDEIVRCPQSLTRVPRAPKFVKGLMSLRGKALPIIDQRHRFAIPGAGDQTRQRVIVVTIDALQAGFLVDSVSEVLTLTAGEIAPAPEFSADSSSIIDRIATSERNGHMILLVDPKALLDRAERDVVATLGKSTEGATPP